MCIRDRAAEEARIAAEQKAKEEQQAEAEVQEVKPEPEKVQEQMCIRDRRSVKQEISYEVKSQEGPPHNATFHVQLFVGGKPICEGSGSSKKEAEQNAAKSAIADFEKIYER